MTKSILRKPASPTTEKTAKMIHAVVVISKTRDQLRKIEKQLGSIDSLLAAIYEDNDKIATMIETVFKWARALGFAVQATRGQANEFYEYLGRLKISGDGSAFIEDVADMVELAGKGGAE